jgi:hypothetical protein
MVSRFFSLKAGIFGDHCGGVRVLVDIILLVLFTLVTVGFTVLGVYLATEHPQARKLFIAMGIILLIVMITQGIRQILSLSSADDAYMSIRRDMEGERRSYDQKIDGLFALLQPRIGGPSPLRKPVHQSTQASILPPSNGKLTVSQTSKPSTREDAPFAAEVVVQTTQTFPSLKFLLQCDKPLVDAHPRLGNGGMVQMMVRSGLAQGHPNIVVYSYGSSVTPFGPANPLVIEVWSKESVICNQAATF